MQTTGWKADNRGRANDIPSFPAAKEQSGSLHINPKHERRRDNIVPRARFGLSQADINSQGGMNHPG
jgi:hypothetical protein